MTEYQSEQAKAVMAQAGKRRMLGDAPDQHPQDEEWFLNLAELLSYLKYGVLLPAHETFEHEVLDPFCEWMVLHGKMTEYQSEQAKAVMAQAGKRRMLGDAPDQHPQDEEWFLNL